VVDDLKQYGNVQRAMIGIQGSDVKSYVDNQKDNGKDIDLGTMEGIYVAKVVEDGAAEVAGLKEGDVITSLDGKKVTSFGELQGVLAKKRPGDKVNITYLRDKKSQKATLTLKNEQGNTKVVKNADTDVLGADFRPITDAQKKQLEISYGLEVIKVNGGKMKDAGVPKGFIIQRVNDEPMRSFDDLQNAVKEANNSKDQMLVIRGIFPTGKKGGFVVYLQNE
jgi:S1-C subfamily serine protease